MIACCECIYVLSTSKLSLYALIPMLLEHTTKNVLVATTSTKLEDISMVTLNKEHDRDYPILYAQSENSIEELIAKMNSKSIRVGIINTSIPLFTEMLKRGNGSFWFSACREGLFTYLPLIEQYATEPTSVLCFDNDKAMIERAQTMYADSIINIYKCVAHSICSTADYDTANCQVSLSGGKECFLFFPPEARTFQACLYSFHDSMSKRAQLRFSETNEEFAFYTVAKMIDVNAIHTMICAMAYVEGNKKGIPLDLIPALPFYELLEKSATLHSIEHLHSLMFNKYLLSNAMKLGENKIIHTIIVSDFIEHLFSSASETVGRGLDYRNCSFTSKLNQHLPLLKGVNDTYAHEILQTFENLFLK